MQIDIHDNEFLEDIFQQGVQEGLRRSFEAGQIVQRKIILDGLMQRFGPELPDWAISKIQTGGPEELQWWIFSAVSAPSLAGVFT